MTAPARITQAERPYSPERLAERWDCSPEKIRRMCHGGDLAWFSLGKLIRIPADIIHEIALLKHKGFGPESANHRV